MKRYAIWNHKTQHFVSVIHKTKIDAEITLEFLQDKFPGNKYYVVEWEIPDDL